MPLTGHKPMPAGQLHGPVGGPGSLDLAVFHEALARQDGPYGLCTIGRSEPKGK